MKSLSRWAICAVCLLGPVAAFGDGMFFERVGQEVRPSIPYQRALVSYRDGRETLIVESTLNAPAGEYAWIVPLPAEPTDMAATTPGVLEAAVSLTPPENIVENDPSKLYRALLFVAFVAGAAVWGLCRKERSPQAAARILKQCSVSALIALFIGLILSAALKVAFAHKGPADAAKSEGLGSSAVQVLSRQTLGSYDTAVVKSRDTGALAVWLKTHGFQIPESAKPIVDGYVTDGWCFMAARLKSKGGQAAAPHPLKVVFPTDRPVYPMRLTALSGRPLLLDLFVVGERFGKVKELDAWASKEQHGTAEDFERGSAFPYSHPGLLSTMWTDAKVVRYRGTLDPSDMDDDVWIGWSDHKPAPVAVWESSAARLRPVVYGLYGFAALFALASAWAVLGSMGFARRLVTGLVVSAVGAGALGLAVRPVRIADFGDGQSLNYQVLHAVHLALEDLRVAPPRRRFPEAFRERVAVRAKQTDPPVDHEIPEVDTPGGYLVLPRGKGWEVVTFSDWSEPPIIWLIDENGRPEGLARGELKRLCVKFANTLGVTEKEVRVDEFAGRLMGFYNRPHWISYRGQANEAAEAEAHKIAERWADRLGVEATRTLLTIELGVDENQPSRPIYGLAALELGHAGRRILDDADKVEITVNLQTGELLRFQPTYDRRTFEPASNRVPEPSAAQTAEKAARTAGLGPRLAETPLLGYVETPRKPEEAEEWIGRPRQMKFAWRFRFERGRVDVDADGGQVISAKSNRRRLKPANAT